MKNEARQMRFFDCQSNDPQVIGRKVAFDGEELRFGLHDARLLEQFRVGLRDEHGKIMRPLGELTSEQVSRFAQFGLLFEKAKIGGNWHHPITPFTLGSHFRQGF